MKRSIEFMLTAGPVELSDRVRGALGGQLLFDYSEPFFELFRDTQEKFKQFFKTTNDIVMMQGEALLGLEAVSVCGLDEGDVVINVESGHYGKGNRYFVEKYGGKAIPVETAWNTVVEPEQLEPVLEAHPEAKILWLVHCETPCGTQIDLEALTKLGKRYGKLVFVDSVSCAGSMPVEVDAWGIDVVSVGSQKVLGAPPGLSAMAISEAAWERFRSVKRPNRYSYFSILDWKEIWLEQGFWPYTASVSDMAALNAAVSEYLELGHEESFRRYAEVGRATRRAVEAMGLELWPDTEGHACNVVTAVAVPEGIDDALLRRRMVERFGVLISGSLFSTPIYGKLVRIGHMGQTCSPSYALTAVTALGHCLRETGCSVDVGAGVEAFLGALDPPEVAT
ncbi:MAG TPA: alanine--glyoxylate aminotransferase family protein [Thermoleophilia bacterium]|nr:alanine--glyoxylate aminotransferase family protein [Thermoleophilia bacterium]